jgi:hypothetical protein
MFGMMDNDGMDKIKLIFVMSKAILVEKYLYH